MQKFLIANSILNKLSEHYILKYTKTEFYSSWETVILSMTLNIQHGSMYSRKRERERESALYILFSKFSQCLFSNNILKISLRCPFYSEIIASCNILNTKPNFDTLFIYFVKSYFRILNRKFFGQLV